VDIDLSSSGYVNCSSPEKDLFSFVTNKCIKSTLSLRIDLVHTNSASLGIMEIVGLANKLQAFQALLKATQ